MSSPAQENSAAVLTRYGLMLFGPEWAAPMARLTGTNQRTISRIRAAANQGRDYPAASGVLGALAESLQPIAAELQRFRRPSA